MYKRQDLHRLIKEWHRIQGRAAKATSPALLYSDFDMLKRVIRDTNADDIDKIVVANAEDYEEVSDICESIAPGPVSYTHLDVYKRQLHQCSLSLL